METNSLSFRLIFTSAVVAFVLLVSAAFLLSTLFQAAIERNFDARLRAVLDSLLANVELRTDGSPGMSGQIADPRFTLPLSGWYWQVSPPEGKALADLASESSLEKRLDPRRWRCADARWRRRCQLLPQGQCRQAAARHRAEVQALRRERMNSPFWWPAISMN